MRWKAGDGQIDFAAHLQHLGHVFADAGAAARCGCVLRFSVMSSPVSPSPRVAPAFEQAILVAQAHRDAVDLRLDEPFQRLAGQQLLDARDPFAQRRRCRLSRRDCRARASARAWRTCCEAGGRLAADALRRRVGRDQLRMRRLERRAARGKARRIPHRRSSARLRRSSGGCAPQAPAGAGRCVREISGIKNGGEQRAGERAEGVGESSRRDRRRCGWG